MKNTDDACDVVKQWLSSNPRSVNARDSDGMTALHLAAQECNIEVGEILLEAGAGTNLLHRGGPRILVMGVLVQQKQRAHCSVAKNFCTTPTCLIDSRPFFSLCACSLELIAT